MQISIDKTSSIVLINESREDILDKTDYSLKCNQAFAVFGSIVTVDGHRSSSHPPPVSAHRVMAWPRCNTIRLNVYQFIIFSFIFYIKLLWSKISHEEYENASFVLLK